MSLDYRTLQRTDYSEGNLKYTAKGLRDAVN